MKRDFDTLDGLRGVAALIVVALHAGPGIEAHLPGAYLAVDFFFILSGFVIGHSYETRLREGLSVGDFMLRRYIRLWPLYLLGSTIGLIVAIGQHEGWALWTSAALGLFMLPALTPALSADGEYPYPFDIPGWSLGFELFANLVFALIARFLTARALTLLLVLGAVMMALAWLHYDGLDVGPRLSNFGGGFGRVTWGFFAGIAIHRLWRRWPSPRVPGWLYAPILILTLMFPPILATPLLIFPALVYLAAGARTTGVVKALYLQLGAASYAAYVLHYPIVQALEPVIQFTRLRETLAFGGAMLLFGGLVTVVFDTPVRAWITARLARPAPRATSGVVLDAI